MLFIRKHQFILGFPDEEFPSEINQLVFGQIAKKTKQPTPNLPLTLLMRQKGVVSLGFCDAAVVHVKRFRSGESVPCGSAAQHLPIPLGKQWKGLRHSRSNARKNWSWRSHPVRLMKCLHFLSCVLDPEVAHTYVVVC